jgi:outer membrane immunogenic protein
MKKIVWLTSIALAALIVSGSAQAADMGAAPVYKSSPPIVTPSWTGFYAGLGLGLRASRADVTTTSASVDGAPFPSSDQATSLPFDGTAFRASPYIGFNWQFAPQWVAGIEGDAGFASQTTTQGGIPFSPGVIDITGAAADSLALKTTWDAGLRGRLGFLLTPATMAYVTGGGAWQHYEVISNCKCGASLGPAVVANSTTKAGWTVGGGLETMLSGHWLARAEYRYADFGATPFTIARSSTTASVNPTIDNFDVKLRTHTVTFGLAYKFD